MANTCGVKGCEEEAVAYLEDKKLWLCGKHWREHRQAAGKQLRAQARAAHGTLSRAEAESKELT